MSDAINSVEKDNEEIRLSKINIVLAVRQLKRWRPDCLHYEQVKRDLAKLGYKVTEDGLRVRVWKEIY